MIIAVDFDGTCVTHRFPEVGEDCPGAVKVLKNLASEGHQLVLYTVRSGKYLESAVDWFRDREIPLAGRQYAPGQTDWTQSNKCYANVYIDDAALGAPLLVDSSGKSYIDWSKVEALIKQVPKDSNPVVDLGQ